MSQTHGSQFIPLGRSRLWPKNISSQYIHSFYISVNAVIDHRLIQIWPLHGSHRSSAAQIGIEIIHFLATDSTTDTNKAARNISSAYVPAIRKDHVTLWSPIVSAIENLGSDHDFLRRLATMLIQLSKLPATFDDNGNQLTANSGRKL